VFYLLGLTVGLRKFFRKDEFHEPHIPSTFLRSGTWFVGDEFGGAVRESAVAGCWLTGSGQSDRTFHTDEDRDACGFGISSQRRALQRPDQ